MRDVGESDHLVPDEEMPYWLTCESTCSICGKTDVSVYPLEAERLECSGCGHFKEAPPLPHEPRGCDLPR